MNELEEKVPLVNGEKVFIRLTSKYSDGPPNWLLIRGVQKKDDGTYNIKVKVKNGDRIVNIVDPRYGRKDVKFALKSGKEITLDQILKGIGQPYQLSMFKESRGKTMKNFLKNMIDEEVKLAIEDFIRPPNGNIDETITLDIAKRILPKNNPYIRSVEKMFTSGHSSVLAVTGTDGKVYEILITPEVYAQYIMKDKNVVSDRKNESNK